MCFAVRRGDFTGRFDVSYNLANSVSAKVAAYPLHQLGSLVVEQASGGTPTSTVADYWNGDIPWISPKDFGGQVSINNSELSITEKGREFSRLKLVPIGTLVLVVRSGILAHTLPAAVLNIPATINQDIKALKFDNRINTFFLAYYLRCHQDTVLPLVRKRGATVHSINTPELLNLKIPVPPLSIQQRLVGELDAARAERDKALCEADELLTSFESWALQRMSIKPPFRASHSCFAVRMDSAVTRLDPFFHAPEFQAIARAVASVQHAQLGELAAFSSGTWNTKEHPTSTFNYIEINGVDRQRGIATATEIAVADAPSRARMAVREDDILVSLTRPHHGSIALLESRHDGSVASTGFAVIRTVDTSRISKEFLWAMLRLSISLKQMERRSSGGNYPAITQDELARVVVPVPDMATQADIVEEITRRKVCSAFLREHAESVWRKARERFEEQLLQGEAE